jgi:hypothetical protein
MQLARFSEIDDPRHDAAEIHLVGLHHTCRDSCGNARVDRVATCFKYLETGVRGEIMPRSDHVLRPHDSRTPGSRGFFQHCIFELHISPRSIPG